MKAIKSLVDQCGTQRRFADVHKLHRNQIARWVKAGALVDEDGNVWIKTKGKIKYTNKC